LATVQAPTCPDPDACLNLARDRLEVAQKLRQSGARDIVTLYRAAKQLHQARQALDGDEDRLPGLKDGYRRATSELATAYTDLQFRFERAQSEGDPQRQLATVQAIRPLCEEDRLPLCTDLERI